MTTPPRILDPRRVPVSGVDSHLPRLPAERLSAEAVRRRFAAAEGFEPEHPGDGGLFGGRAPASAAVLVPLVAREQGLSVLLTRRTEHLRDHAGQVSFPGGRSEPGDDGPTGTALRECEEEVGLEPQRVDVVGTLPVYTTVTHFVVTPVVGLITPPFVLRPDPVEVAEAFEVPLVWLMDPAHHHRHRFEFDGVERQFLSMPWAAPGGDGLPRDYFIWGATAAMLRNLYRFLAR